MGAREPEIIVQVLSSPIFTVSFLLETSLPSFAEEIYCVYKWSGSLRTPRNVLSMTRVFKIVASYYFRVISQTFLSGKVPHAGLKISCVQLSSSAEQISTPHRSLEWNCIRESLWKLTAITLWRLHMPSICTACKCSASLQPSTYPENHFQDLLPLLCHLHQTKFGEASHGSDMSTVTACLLITGVVNISLLKTGIHACPIRHTIPVTPTTNPSFTIFVEWRRTRTILWL